MKKKTYRDVKGKLMQLLESVLSVSWRDFNKSCNDTLLKVGKNGTQMKSQINDTLNRQVV